MHKQKKAVEVRTLPKDLPMPKYEYQKPHSSSYTYQHKEEPADEKKVEGEERFCLQNLHFD